jgi:hypothetical protein
MTPWIALARLPFSNGGPSNATTESLAWEELLPRGLPRRTIGPAQEDA